MGYEAVVCLAQTMDGQASEDPWLYSRFRVLQTRGETASVTVAPALDPMPQVALGFGVAPVCCCVAADSPIPTLFGHAARGESCQDEVVVWVERACCSVHQHRR